MNGSNFSHVKDLQFYIREVLKLWFSSILTFTRARHSDLYKAGRVVLYGGSLHQAVGLWGPAQVHTLPPVLTDGTQHSL